MGIHNADLCYVVHRNVQGKHRPYSHTTERQIVIWLSRKTCLDKKEYNRSLWGNLSLAKRTKGFRYCRVKLRGFSGLFGGFKLKNKYS